MSLDRIDVIVSQKPEEWRRQHSRWIFVVGFGFGIFSLFGWLWAGVQAKSPKIWRIVAVWSSALGVATAISLAFNGEKGTTESDLSISFLMTVWIASIAHAFIVRNDVLKGVAAYEDELLRVGIQNGLVSRVQNTDMADSSLSVPTRTSVLPASAPSFPPSASYPDIPKDFQVDANQYYGQPGSSRSWAPTSRAKDPIRSTRSTARRSSQSVQPLSTTSSSTTSEPDPIDVNTAPQTILLTIFDRTTVERIMTVRGERGGFHDIDELVSAVGIQPHQLLALQGRVTFSKFKPPGPQTHRRILDL